MSPSHDRDLDLARRCAAGDEHAWEQFVREFRPVLYRAADALDPSGGARELADSLYADLYGTEQRDGSRRSLFQYFHGRSSLATWLRAVLTQRWVDRVRAARRFEALADDHEQRFAAPAPDVAEPDRRRLALRLGLAFAAALERLDVRDRLRLGCYYLQQLTLAETGRVVGEHEATVSRQLARTRKRIRGEVERQLRSEGLSEEEIDLAFETAVEDAGTVDLERMLGAVDRKESAGDRSIG